MADGIPSRYRALVLCPVRRCPTCARDVTVRDDKCTECGGDLPKPSGPRIPRPRRELQAIPATGFGLVHAAAAMGSLETCLLASIN
jgi:hypothetical protein